MTKKMKMLTAFSMAVCSQVTAAESMTPQYLPQSEHVFYTADHDHFSGNANFSRFPLLPSQGDVAPAIVNFAPNAFTHWHTHSQGQYLIVTEGTGRFQQWGQPIQIISKGDVVWVAPNIKHWHGAGELTAMSHIAISPVQDNLVTWLEEVQPEHTDAILPVDHIATPDLTQKQLAIVPLAIATTQGDQSAVKNAIEQGLSTGLTINELKEAISHQFAYIGAPKTLNGMITLKSVLETRNAQGISDVQGKQATELGNVDYYQLGSQKLVALTQRPAQSAIFDFAPAVDYAIKAQLFGYQFSRDNLGDVERELATVGSLVGLGESVNAQLRSHLSLLKNLGMTENHFNQLVQIVNRQQANNLQLVWTDVNTINKK